MEQCFAAFDRDGDGFMTLEDFGVLCRSLFRNEDAVSYEVDDMKMKEIFEVFDLNEDNNIDLDEFRLCWQHWIKKIVRPCSVLLVVDVQNDFISGTLSLSNCPAKHNGEEVLEPINRMIENVPFDHVFYTMDWHPKNHISFIDNVKLWPVDESSKIKGDEAKLYDTITFSGSPPFEQQLWPAHCIQDTWGAKLHESLKVVESGMTIYKGTTPGVDFYSAFWDNQKVKSTTLNEELKKRRITDVYCCGIAYDICVGRTAADSLISGYRTVMIEDACRAVSLENMKSTKEKLEGLHAVFVNSDKVRNMVRGKDRRPELGYYSAMQLKGKLPTISPPKSPLSPSDFRRAVELD
ncbi:nicotinamidase-like [Artemia franciscana]|uniref:nicotinamidase-like n=1 Tax=Artemia franciscana TaxID=6661 RepID=UPI0032DBCF7D